MNDLRDEQLQEYYDSAESWSEDRLQKLERSNRRAWMVALFLAVLLILLAIALVLLVPLRRDIPYTLLVDRQTGYVEALQPLGEGRITADAALTRSFLAQYVVAREGFSAETVQSSYRKVGLLSAEQARQSYLTQMRSQDGASPFSALVPGSSVDVDIRSISSLEPNRALVRFETVQTSPSGQGQLAQNWAAVIDFRYIEAPMSQEDRLENPLGFQVIRYRRNVETTPREVASEQGGAVQ